MSAAVISIDKASRSGEWSLLEIAWPGSKPRPLGILLRDRATDRLSLRLLESAAFDDLEEQEIDLVDMLPSDLQNKANELGASVLLNSLEDSLSGFLRVSDRTELEFRGSAQRAADRLFDEYVDGEVRPWITHLPLYGLRAAATKFGEGMDSPLEEWIRAEGSAAKAGTKLRENMFVAHVVGRSMEPLIPDGSLCIFRAGVTGSRQGKRLLIEKFGETDFANRYTVKRYTSHKRYDSDGNWEHEEIRLEPLNPEFEAFTLGPDEFRVIGEFVEVLDS